MADVGPVPVPRGRLLLRALPLLAVWAFAAAPFGLWLLAATDPEFAVRVRLVAATALARGGLGVAALALAAALFYPPFPAWLRLVADRMRTSVGSDRGPLLRALSELQHFTSAQRHLEVARLALQRSELELAGVHFAQALDADPMLPAAHHGMGMLLLRIGRVAQALAAFERAEALEPGFAFGDALLHAGRCRALLGDHAGAAAVLREHGRRHGGSRKSHVWLGDALRAAGDEAGAREAFAFAAAVSRQRLTAEENWFRALARVRLWRPRRLP